MRLSEQPLTTPVSCVPCRGREYVIFGLDYVGPPKAVATLGPKVISSVYGSLTDYTSRGRLFCITTATIRQLQKR